MQTLEGPGGVEAIGATEGHAESLPLPDGFADVVISNGALNLTLDKTETLREWFRIVGALRA